MSKQKERLESIAKIISTSGIGDIKYMYHPDDDIPEYLEPLKHKLIFEESSSVEKGRGYFLDMRKFTTGDTNDLKFYGSNRTGVT